MHILQMKHLAQVDAGKAKEKVVTLTSLDEDGRRIKKEQVDMSISISLQTRIDHLPLIFYREQNDKRRSCHTSQI